MGRPEDQDREVSKLLKERNPKVLEGLYEYGPRLERNLRRKFRSFIPDDEFENLVSDTLIEGFEEGDRYDPERGSLSTWLNVRAHYKALQFLRHQNLLEPMPIDLDGLGHALSSDIEDGISDKEYELQRVLRQAVDALPPNYLIVVQLHYYEELSIEEVATKLMLTPGTVKTRLYRARVRMRKWVGAHFQKGEVEEIRAA